MKLRLLKCNDFSRFPIKFQLYCINQLHENLQSTRENVKGLHMIALSYVHNFL